MNTQITINIKGEGKMSVDKGTRYYEIISKQNNPDIIGIRVNNELVSLNKKATKDQTIEFFDVNSIEGSKMYKAGLKFSQIKRRSNTINLQLRSSLFNH